MDEPALRQLLDDVRSGTVGPDDAVARLRRLPFVDLGFARVDHHRALRQRAGEAVYAPGKTAGQCAEIVAELLGEPGQTPVLLTRADQSKSPPVWAWPPRAKSRNRDRFPRCVGGSPPGAPGAWWS